MRDWNYQRLKTQDSRFKNLKSSTSSLPFPFLPFPSLPLSSLVFLHLCPSQASQYFVPPFFPFRKESSPGSGSGQVRSGPVKSGPVRSGPVRSGQVRSGQARSIGFRQIQSKSNQIHPKSTPINLTKNRDLVCKNRLKDKNKVDR
jgi:hypothetical protein